MNDLIGQKFGRLIVIKRMGNNKWGNLRWLCRCVCGKEKTIQGSHLKSGATKSCGCLNREKTSIVNTKHGHLKNGKRSKTHIVWQHMIQRCTNLRDKGYPNYGGRGIKVCKRWQNSFENFLEDMGEVPEGYQIDRINNNGNYCKENCRWSTRKEQQRNKRDNHLETYKGKTQCLAAWAEEFDINYSTLCSRIFRSGWSIEKALTTPIQKKGKR